MRLISLKNIVKVCLLGVLTGWFTLSMSFAQETPGLRDRADRYYEEYQYAKAIPIYLRLADSKNPRLLDLERLADSYAKMDKYEDAENWYARIVEDAKSTPENFLAYAWVLKQNARYSEAKTALQRYAEETGDLERVVHEIAGCDSAEVWMANPTAHKLRNEAGINTERAEFGAYPIGGGVFYAGEPSLEAGGEAYGWTGEAYLRIFTANGDASTGLSAPSLWESDLNVQPFHVGPVSSDASGQTLFVTRTYPGKPEEVQRSSGRKYRTQKLELFIYEKDGQGKWVGTPFAYNNVEEYSVGHASLDPSGEILYFASDRPGGHGGTDIWYSVKQADGSWGSPENAGPEINTAGDELFPGIAPSGTLYFSSNGWVGMGGLDIFSAQGSKNNWQKPQNLRFPMNSAGDDFAMVSTQESDQGMSGFLSSNRKEGKGKDDIYSFSYEKPKIILVLKGVAYNKATGEELPQTAVTLFSGERQLVSKQSTRTDGVFIFELQPGMEYSILGQKSGFYSDSARVSTVGLVKSDTLLAALYLDPLFEIGKTLQLENIHYDFDKHNIRKDAAEILDELVRIMRDNPSLVIELSSHTDSRGSDSYNLALSERRAHAAVEYLVSRGIARDRMQAKGYGETRLLNECSNGVACSIAQHQANRRTEITVLKY